MKKLTENIENRGGINLKLTFFTYGILEQGGGFENYVIDTSRGLTDRYNDVRVSVLTSTPALTKKLQKFLSIYFLKKHEVKNIYRESRHSILSKLSTVTYEQFRSRKQLISKLKKADVIYTKNEILELVLLKSIGYKNLPPIVVGIHTPLYYSHTPSLSSKLHNFLYTSYVYKFLLKGTVAIKVNGEDDKIFVQNKLGYKNVSVIHHAFYNSERRVESKNDQLNILFVGRLTEQKGVDIFIDIAKKLLSQKNGELFNFKVAGSGESQYERELLEIAKTYKNFSFLGHVKNENVSKLYNWADVTLIPSRYETLNKVAIETCIAGKIVITTDISGPREFIVNGFNGYMVNLSENEFIDKVNYIFNLKQNDADKYILLGQNAQETISRDFNPDKVYGQFYNEFLIEKK